MCCKKCCNKNFHIACLPDHVNAQNVDNFACTMLQYKAADSRTSISMSFGSRSPCLDTQPWHNPDEPFVLARKTGKISKCQGCSNGYKDEEFVVRHKEGKRIFNKTLKRQMLVQGNGYYHANCSCIRSRHDYFTPKSLIVPPNLPISKEQIQFLNKKRGFNIRS